MELRLTKSVKDDTGWHLPGQVLNVSEEEGAFLLKKKCAVLFVEPEPVEPVEPEEDKPEEAETDEGGTEEGAGEEDDTGDDENVEVDVVDVLCEINGVSTEIANALINVGYETVKEIAEADPAELEKISGIGAKSSEKIIASAIELSAK